MLLKKKYIQKVVYKRIKHADPGYLSISKFCRNCDHSVRKLDGISCRSVVYSRLKCNAISIYISLKMKDYMYIPIY